MGNGLVSTKCSVGKMARPSRNRGPGGVPGLVVSGNLQRASIFLSQGDLYEKGSNDRNIILGHAAEHAGKLVGGLLMLKVMFDISPKDWDKRYTYNVDSVVAAARQPIQTASRAYWSPGSVCLL